jgi:hypothetical protein
MYNPKQKEFKVVFVTALLTDYYGSGRLNGALACDPSVAHVISRLLKRQFSTQYCFSSFLSFRFLYLELPIERVFAPSLMRHRSSID